MKEQLIKWAIMGFEHIKRVNGKEVVKSVELDARKPVELPKDYINFIKIGVCHE